MLMSLMLLGNPHTTQVNSIPTNTKDLFGVIFEPAPSMLRQIEIHLGDWCDLMRSSPNDIIQTAVTILGSCGPRPFNVEPLWFRVIVGRGPSMLSSNFPESFLEFLFLDFLETCCPSIEGAGSTRTHMDFLLPQHWRGQLNNHPNGFFAFVWIILTRVVGPTRKL